jgi:TAG lipase/lysophosphatidylethanolamine acyltransferase
MGWSRDTMAQGVVGFFQACVWVIWNVGFYWLRVSRCICHPLKRHKLIRRCSQKFWRWLTTKNQKQLLIETLKEARRFEEWQAAAFELDKLLGNDWWRSHFHTVPIRRGAAGDDKKYYDYDLIEERTNFFQDAINDPSQIMEIHTRIRTGLSRNIGGILHPKLYSKANFGTKLLIETYVECVSAAIKIYAAYPITPTLPLTPQDKLSVLSDARMAYGRTVLVLQGGSIFGLCHLGVVKAMYQRTLLPRVIAGSGTGALMAAWVSVHTDEQLLRILSGDRIDLSAFVASSERAAAETQESGFWLWKNTLYRRVRRFLKSGFILDPQVLEEAVRSNVGDMTFKEAYDSTSRILNITIASSGPGSITLLNYLTAPHVLIWSAALVSNANDRTKTSIRLMCKDATGHIVPYDHFAAAGLALYGSNPIISQESPLSRLGELFNINHYVVSQARPYIAPFLYPTLRIFKTSPLAFFTRLILSECQLRLRQANIAGILPLGMKRLLMDEIVPGTGPAITLVPEIRLSDWVRLLRNPTKAEIDHWIERGEKSVWPNVVQLWIRLGVEFELERSYQHVRRHPYGGPESDEGAIARPIRKRRGGRTTASAARSG